ncbi:MAG: CocE/NonD family hydrolase [Anaerolineae bacterium]
MKRRIAIAIGLAGLGAYRFRRQWIGRLLGLTPARYHVAVERNLPVPMPDGVILMADHYMPQAQGTFPTVLIRSPYGRGLDVPLLGLRFIFIAQRFAERGYHVIVQGTRGRFDSGGEFEPFVNEAADGQATLDWIASQPWFDGNLGMWGPSYLGYVQWAVAAGAPAHLKALVPSLTTSRRYAFIYPDGPFSLDTALRWILLLDTMDQPVWKMLGRLRTQERTVAPALQHLPAGEADARAVGQPVSFYRDWLIHPDADDPYWNGSDHGTGMERVTAPIHLMSGWYDIFLRGLLDDYAALKATGHVPYLTIGPWFHLESEPAWEALRLGIDWFDVHLKGDRRRLREHPVRIYVMGANEWREMADWPPPAQETRYYLSAGQRLSIDGPAGTTSADHYRYDPANPTPVVGGALFNPQGGPQDNRSLEARPDVLCYTTHPLTADVEVIGPVRLELYVRSSLAHTDFVGRLCDVHPDGRSMNVCDGILRVEPGTGEPQPDGSLRIEIDMWATAHRFRRGHRIRLQVASAGHPRWDRNLGTGEPIGTGTGMAVAVQTIYHDDTHPSALVLPVNN